ncbi:MAG: Gfo/Idh/MocA family oxidoreductase [Ectothiorhodospiraceae bacterium]|nr:Gfo/Idh/MocA family oxidoreductase [Ectothiorhodospiraceae bacterium]
MSDPVRIAVIGLGDIGARHLEIARREPACTVVAVADPSTAAAGRAERAGCAYFADYREMLDRGGIDGAIVAVPNQLHAPVAHACVEHGVHALVEKPFTDTVAAGQALVAAARAAGVRLAVGHHRRFDPATERAHALIADGAIGEILAVQCTWAARKHDTYYDVQWRREPGGGGPVLINLIHDIDLLRHLCGDIVRVHAEVGPKVRGHAVENTVAVTLRFATGAVGTALVSDATPSPWTWEAATGDNPALPASGRNAYRFMGSEGALGFPRLELWRHADVRTGSWLDPIASTAVETGSRAAIARQLAQFCRVVRGEEEPRTSGEDGLATLAATVAVLESGRTGEPVVPAC